MDTLGHARADPDDDEEAEELGAFETQKIAP